MKWHTDNWKQVFTRQYQRYQCGAPCLCMDTTVSNVLCPRYKQSKIEKAKYLYQWFFYSLVEKRQKTHAMVEMLNVTGKGTCADALCRSPNLQRVAQWSWAVYLKGIVRSCLLCFLALGSKHFTIGLTWVFFYSTGKLTNT